MNKQEFNYKVRETLRLRGWWYFTWRIAFVVGIIYVLLPSFESTQIGDKNSSNEATAQEEYVMPRKMWQKTKHVERDLSKIMTIEQSLYYWSSFNWMMEYGEPNKPRSFESPRINMIFLTQEIKKTPSNKTCRTFSEKIVLAGQANARYAVACKRGVADWCRKLKGENFYCRSKAPTGIDALSRNVFDTHNLEVDIQRNLYKLPSF